MNRKVYIKDNLCYIPLQDGREAITNAEYYDKIKDYKWFIKTDSGYVAANINRKIQYLSNFLFRTDIYKKIKFINAGLDYRKENIKYRDCYIENDICYIPLNDGQIAFCDKEHFEKVNKYSWYVASNDYVMTTINRKHILLHRYVSPKIKNFVDHINRNKLDNRSCNLREATISENGANSKLNNRNTSGYRGVIYFKRNNTWRARITKESKTYNLGYYKTAKEAAIVYNIKAKELFGNFATLNTIQ